MENSKVYCHCYSATKKLDKGIIKELLDLPEENQTPSPSWISSADSNETEFSKRSTLPYNITTSTSSTPKTLRTSIRVQKRNRSGSFNKSSKSDDLKKDLLTIKNHLVFLTSNRTEALRIAEELQRRYKKALKKKREQKETIYRLKTENMALNMIVLKIAADGYARGCGDSEDVVDVKEKLDMYEIKMNELYQECINSLKMMQDSRDKINFAIKQKSEEYRELAESNRRLREMIGNEEMKCCELEMKCCRLEKENASYQCHYYNMATKIDELQTNFNRTTSDLARNQEASVARVLEKNEETIQELNTIIEQLQKQISGNKVEDKEDLKDKYNQALSQNNELTHKLNRINECNQDRCLVALNKIKSQKAKQAMLLEEQKKLILQMDELNSTLKEKEKLILQLKQSNNEKDMMIQRQKEEIIDMLQKPVANESKSQPESYTSTEINSSDCFSLSKELENLIASLYAEIDKTLVKDKIIQEQFEHNCFLKCSLSSKEAELTYVKDELKRAKNKLQGINFDRPGIDFQKSVLSTCEECECEEEDDCLDEEQLEENTGLDQEHPSDELFYYSVRNVPN